MISEAAALETTVDFLVSGLLAPAQATPPKRRETAKGAGCTQDGSCSDTRTIPTTNSLSRKGITFAPRTPEA